MSSPPNFNNQSPEHQQATRSSQQIKVFVRNRPLRNQFSKRCLKLIDHGVALNFKDKIYQLYFDNVFDEDSTQQNVFNDSCKPLLDDVIRGNNSSLFVYGQTGTGKTYTMGTLETIKRQDQGLIPLSLNYLINYFQNSKQDNQWSLSISFMQIYMQEIYDLLNPRNGKLKIRQDHEYGETYVQDLVIVPISNYKQSIELINAGLQYRKTGNQKMNAVSSRSHTILTVYLSQKISSTEFMWSTLSMIDLAGSQRIKKTNSADIRLQEAKFINTSLSALGNVISELSYNDSQRFIPYRTSKLTRILKNSLAGRAKITVICTLQISESNLYETYSTLLFADRCKAIRFPNQPMISVETFQDLDQERDLKLALEKAKQKQQQYIEKIRQLQSNSMSNSHVNSKIAKDSQRQIQLGGIIQSIYRLFGQINDHLKKVLDPQSKSDFKKQIPKVNSNTSVASIKTNLTKFAQQTIDKVNNLSTIAFGQGKSNSITGTNLQSEALLSLLLENLRSNIKLQQTIFIKDGKQSLQKQIALEEYQKEKKSQIITKLKNKKQTSLVNHLQEIWAQRSGSFSANPLQSLLNNIRRGQINYNYNDQERSSTNFGQSYNKNEKQFTSPKQFLKMLTRQQSSKKQGQMLIKDDDELQQQESKQSDGDVEQQNQSQINYFQKSSPSRNLNSSRRSDKQKQKESNRESDKKMNNTGNNQIKKLLENLIASKGIHEDRKKNSRKQKDKQ